jgi:transposase
MTTATRGVESTAPTQTLFLALELGSTIWKLAFATTRREGPRLRQIPARDLGRLQSEIARAKARGGLPADAPVRSCYEAGREGFWLHRALGAHGLANVVIDASSIAVDRRARRAKTDRLDATALVTQLMNAAAGDRRGWREVHVPSVQAEADRQLSREWDAVQADRTALRNRIQGLLATQGVRVALTADFLARLAAVRVWDGSRLPAPLIARLERDWAHLRHLEDRLRTLRQLRHARVANHHDVVAQQTRQLAGLRGVGVNGALSVVTELFAWRRFTNRRQIGACVGLTPTPHQSDQRRVEQGISRSGNRRIRALSIELAWAWVRYQPMSALTQWFQRRFGQHARARRIGIVALARKLLIAWWRYLATGVRPDGALLKA